MTSRPVLSIAECIGIVENIQNQTGIECKRYGAYDKGLKIFTPFEAYAQTLYTHSLRDEDYVKYLLRHRGEIYFPALVKGQQLAFLAIFDTKALYEKFGTPPKQTNPKAMKGQIEIEEYIASLKEG